MPDQVAQADSPPSASAETPARVPAVPAGRSRPICRRTNRCPYQRWAAPESASPRAAIRAPQQAPDARDQNRQIEGLGQIIVGARGEALQHISGWPRAVSISVGTNCPAWRISRHHGESILARQHTSSTTTSNAAAFGMQHSSAASPVSTTCTSIALGLQVEAQTIRQMLFVFDDQDPRHAIPIASDRQLQNENVLPRPGPSLSAHARPPCRLRHRAHDVQPRPVPLTRVASGPGTR